MPAKSDFNGLRVAAFESRRGDEIARMIERQGGVPHVSPSMREVPLGENPEALEWWRQQAAWSMPTKSRTCR